MALTVISLFWLLFAAAIAFPATPSSPFAISSKSSDLAMGAENDKHFKKFKTFLFSNFSDFLLTFWLFLMIKVNDDVILKRQV